MSCHVSAVQALIKCLSDPEMVTRKEAAFALTRVCKNEDGALSLSLARA